jgi:hypothetical protein
MQIPTRTSLLCVRSSTLFDAAIRAGDGDNFSHAGIRVDDSVIDVTLRYGVKEWSYNDWLQGRELVDDVPVVPSSQGAEATAIRELRERIGQRYDRWEIAGFVLLRDLGDPNRPICSRLAYDYIRTATGLIIAGRQGRMGPRLVRSNLHSFNQGLLSASRSRNANQP